VTGAIVVVRVVGAVVVIVRVVVLEVVNPPPVPEGMEERGAYRLIVTVCCIGRYEMLFSLR